MREKLTRYAFSRPSAADYLTCRSRTASCNRISRFVSVSLWSSLARELNRLRNWIRTRENIHFVCLYLSAVGNTKCPRDGRWCHTRTFNICLRLRTYQYRRVYRVGQSECGINWCRFKPSVLTFSCTLLPARSFVMTSAADTKQTGKCIASSWLS